MTPSDEHRSDHPPLSLTERISQQAQTGNSGVGVESWEPNTTMFLSLKSQHQVSQDQETWCTAEKNEDENK